MKSRIHTDSMSREFRLLRNRIEAEAHGPAVLLVTSATDRDGCSLTAFGLAESLSKTHQRTVLVTTDHSATEALKTLVTTDEPVKRRRATDRLHDGALANTGSGLSFVRISSERVSTISRSNVASMVDELRSAHDYVIIDGGDLPNNGFAILLAALADVALVTFLSGRQEVPQDRVMLDNLERTEVKVLGTVLTTQAAIDAFEHRDVVAQDQEVVGARKAGANPLVARLEVALQRMGISF